MPANLEAQRAIRAFLDRQPGLQKQSFSAGDLLVQQDAIVENPCAFLVVQGELIEYRSSSLPNKGPENFIVDRVLAGGFAYVQALFPQYAALPSYTTVKAETDGIAYLVPVGWFRSFGGTGEDFVELLTAEMRSRWKLIDFMVGILQAQEFEGYIQQFIQQMRMRRPGVVPTTKEMFDRLLASATELSRNKKRDADEGKGQAELQAKIASLETQLAQLNAEISRRDQELERHFVQTQRLETERADAKAEAAQARAAMRDMLEVFESERQRQAWLSQGIPLPFEPQDASGMLDTLPESQTEPPVSSTGRPTIPIPLERPAKAKAEVTLDSPFDGEIEPKPIYQISQSAPLPSKNRPTPPRPRAKTDSVSLPSSNRQTPEGEDRRRLRSTRDWGISPFFKKKPRGTEGPER